MSTDLGATKVFDFKNLSSDAGLYVNNETGELEFVGTNSDILASGALTVPPATPIVANTYVSIGLTRAASGTTTVSENGVQVFQFNDTDGLAVLGDATATGNAYLTVFKDDGGGIGGALTDESSVGNLADLQLYNLPEPTSLAVLVTAGIGSLLRRRPAKRQYAH